MDYFYYRFLTFTRVLSKGINYALYRAAFISTLMTFMNFAVILDLMHIGISKTNLVYFFGAFVLWYFLGIRYFLNAKRYRKVLTKFGDASWITSLIWNLVVLLYMIGSTILFILSITKF